MAQTIKNLPAMQETQVWSLGQEDPLEKGIGTHSSILPWRIPWAEIPGGLQSMGSQRVKHNWVTNTFTFKPQKKKEVKHNLEMVNYFLLKFLTTLLSHCIFYTKSKWVWFFLHSVSLEIVISDHRESKQSIALNQNLHLRVSTLKNAQHESCDLSFI